MECFQGIAVKEYLTDVGPADYVLFVDKKPVGIIEAKKDEEGYRLNVVEEQSSGTQEKHISERPAGSSNFWAQDEDLYVSLASRLARLDRQINEDERATFAEKANGKTINQIVKDLLNAYNPDIIELKAS